MKKDPRPPCHQCSHRYLRGAWRRKSCAPCRYLSLWKHSHERITNVKADLQKGSKLIVKK